MKNDRPTVLSGPLVDQVPDIPSGEPFAEEWQTFKRELPRLIRDGSIGKYAVIKGTRLLGVWDTLSDADLAGRRELGKIPFLIQEIQLHLKWTSFVK